MKDNFNRRISYLRVSVTDLCNLRCDYCMPCQGIKKKQPKDILSQEEILKIIRSSVDMGINKVRITGGEPLIKPGIIDLCSKIVNTKGIENVGITTNGILLKSYVKDLKSIGINQINISLDTFDKDKYKKLTRGGNLKEVLEGIDEALSLGFQKVKINVVLMAGINDDEIDDFIKFSHEKGMEIRFIELMPIGEGRQIYNERYICSEIVIKKHPELIPLERRDGVAKIYQIPKSKGTIGLINPISCSFCSECNRLRLTADGKVKPCLHSSQEFNVKDLSDEELKKAFIEAILNKPENMNFSLNDNKKATIRKMNEIGG